MSNQNNSHGLNNDMMRLAVQNLIRTSDARKAGYTQRFKSLQQLQQAQKELHEFIESESKKQDQLDMDLKALLEAIDTNNTSNQNPHLNQLQNGIINH